jgi:DNA-binding NarL/FixJ family response regulator
MEFEPLKVLLVGNDERFAHGVAEMLRASGGVTEVATAATLEAGLAELAAHSYHAILFELPSANAAGLFQVTQITTKIPRLPVVVFGPANDGIFGTEIIGAGAQDYLAKDEIEPQALQHALRCAIERQGQLPWPF